MKLEARMKGLTAALAGSFFLAGCSGINASHSVSPASFFLPGILKVQPQKPAPTDPTFPVGEDLAQLQP